MLNDMRVVVTGAAGHLGAHLVPLLSQDGFETVGLDVVKLPDALLAQCEFVKADLTDRAQVEAACSGAEMVIHCASVHPWKTYTDAQYLDNNIKGTWNVYSAAATLSIDRIVLTSSIAAIGYGAGASWPVTEDVDVPPLDLYSFTKHAQEDIATMFAETGQIRTIALRPPGFMPRDNLETGFSLTGPFALVEDIASAHLAAARVLAERQQPGAPMGRIEAVLATNRLPYTADDQEIMISAGSAKPLVRKHWPEAYEWLIARGYEGAWIPAVYDLSKAKRLLNWEPVHNFEQWFACAVKEL